MHLSAFEPTDYEFLLRFANEDTRKVWRAQKETILDKRRAIDAFVASVLETYKRHAPMEWPCPLCRITFSASSPDPSARMPS